VAKEQRLKGWMAGFSGVSLGGFGGGEIRDGRKACHYFFDMAQEVGWDMVLRLCFVNVGDFESYQKC